MSARWPSRSRKRSAEGHRGRERAERRTSARARRRQGDRPHTPGLHPRHERYDLVPTSPAGTRAGDPARSRARGPARDRGRSRQPEPAGTYRSYLAQSRRSKQPVRFFVAKFNKPDIQTLADMLYSGELKPAIDRTYELPKRRPRCARSAKGTSGEARADDVSRYRPAPWRGSISERTASAASSARR